MMRLRVITYFKIHLTIFILASTALGQKGGGMSENQKVIGTHYLRLMDKFKGSLFSSGMESVSCHKLEQDLVKTHRFYYCRAIHRDNAVDGGTWDEGRVVAWNGKSALLHVREQDDWDSDHQSWKGLKFTSLEAVRNPMVIPPEPAKKDPDGEALSVALDHAVESMRAKSSQAMVNGFDLNAKAFRWLRFFLTVHFDAPEIKWSAGWVKPPAAHHPNVKHDLEVLQKIEKEASGAAGRCGVVEFERGLATEKVFILFEKTVPRLNIREISFEKKYMGPG